MKVFHLYFQLFFIVSISLQAMELDSFIVIKESSCVGNNTISHYERTVESLLNDVENNKFNAQKLDIRSSASSENLIKLFAKLAQNKVIKEIIIYASAFDEKADEQIFAEIANFIKINTSLESLSLFHTPLTNARAEILLSAVKSNSHLKNLKITGFHFDLEAGTNLVDMLVLNKTLAKLHISSLDKFAAFALVASLSLTSFSSLEVAEPGLYTLARSYFFIDEEIINEHSLMHANYILTKRLTEMAKTRNVFDRVLDTMSNKKFSEALITKTKEAIPPNIDSFLIKALPTTEHLEEDLKIHKSNPEKRLAQHKQELNSLIDAYNKFYRDYFGEIQKCFLTRSKNSCAPQTSVTFTFNWPKEEIDNSQTYVVAEELPEQLVAVQAEKADTSEIVKLLLNEPRKLLGQVESQSYGSSSKIRVADRLNKNVTECACASHYLRNPNGNDLRGNIENQILTTFNQEIASDNRADTHIALTILGAYQEGICLETYVLVARLLDAGYKKIHVQIVDTSVPNPNNVVEFLAARDFNALFNVTTVVYKNDIPRIVKDGKSSKLSSNSLDNLDSFIAISITKHEKSKNSHVSFSIACAEDLGTNESMTELKMLKGHDVLIGHRGDQMSIEIVKNK